MQCYTPSVIVVHESFYAQSYSTANGMSLHHHATRYGRCSAWRGVVWRGVGWCGVVGPDPPPGVSGEAACSKSLAGRTCADSESGELMVSTACNRAHVLLLGSSLDAALHVAAPYAGPGVVAALHLVNTGNR